MVLKRFVRLTVLAAVIACFGPVASALAAAPTYVNDATAGHWTVYSDDAVWHIYHGCGTNGVGPGYVAFVQMKNRQTGAYDGPVLVNDVNPDPADFPLGQTAEDRQIGLGKFVWRNARATAGNILYYNATYKNAWPASNRCIQETHTAQRHGPPRSGRPYAGPSLLWHRRAGRVCRGRPSVPFA